MLKCLNHKKKGFTLIEVVVALGILAIFSGFAIASISAIAQARMRETAQTFKTEFELARDFAKTHGGDAVLSIEKTTDGMLITRTSDTVTDEQTEVGDGTLSVFYKLTGDDAIYELGVTDATSVDNKTLEMTFSQTHGAIIGPDMVDYIILSNGSKNYKLFIKQSTGMIYYDYEIEESNMDENRVNNSLTYVELPQFMSGGLPYDTITVDYKEGSSVQPEISYDSRYVKISGEYRAVEKGEYYITFSLKDPYSTAWISGDVEDIILKWKIE